MSVYEAKATFMPKAGEEVNGASEAEVDNVLMFLKGELFEILETETEGKSWLGVRALKDNTVGFVPASFLKKKALSSSRSASDLSMTSQTHELNLQKLMEIQKRSNFRHPSDRYPEMIPDPDYSDSEEEPVGSQDIKPTLNGHMMEDGIIVPRKLPNPCLESKDHNNLHKELLFNQKIGKNVLNQKSELRKAMDKFQDEQKRKELEQEQLGKRTVFEKKLEEQANKLKMQEETEEEKLKEDDSSQQSEFLRVHARLKARMDCQ